MKHFKEFWGILLLALSVNIASCTSESVKIANDLSENYDYDGKTIEVEGRFDAPMMVRTNGNTTSLNFITYNDYLVVHSGHITIPNVKLAYGEGKNSVVINAEKGEKFIKQDVVIYDKDGNKISLDDKVKIKGLVNYLNNDKDGKSFIYEITDVEIETK